jgi:hypothetical protein
MSKGLQALSGKDHAFLDAIFNQKLNQTYAYMAAFDETDYHRASVKACKLLKRADISEAYAQMKQKSMEKFIERAVVNKEWVLEQLLIVHKKCMGDDGEDFDAKNALNALAMIGKHIDVDAFVRDNKRIEDLKNPLDITPPNKKMENVANKIGFFLQKALQAQKNKPTDI